MPIHLQCYSMCSKCPPLARSHALSQARIQKCGLGVDSNGGAEGVDGGEVWGGGTPLPVGVGSGEGPSGEGAQPLPRKILAFSPEMVHFDAFWSTF